MENSIPGSESQNQVEVAIVIPDKVDFKPKLVRRDKEG
jgi:hypothetical protein